MSLPLTQAPRCQLAPTFALETQISALRIPKLFLPYVAHALWVGTASRSVLAVRIGRYDCGHCLSLKEADAARGRRGELGDEKHDPSGVELRGAHSRNACGHRHHEHSSDLQQTIRGRPADGSTDCRVGPRADRVDQQIRSVKARRD